MCIYPLLSGLILKPRLSRRFTCCQSFKFFYFIFNVKFICIKIKFQRPSHNDFISNLDVRFIGIKIKFQWPSHWFVANQCLPSRRLRCHPSLPGHTFLCHLLQVTNTLISLSLSLSWYIFTICLNYKHFDFFTFVFILVWTHLFYTIYYKFPNTLSLSLSGQARLN